MPKGIEIERKYIIAMPDVERLSVEPEYTVSRITQTYIESEAGVTQRVRERVFSDRTQRTETKKIRIDKMSVHELEREISEDEYNGLLPRIKQGTKPIHKTRHTFEHLGKTIEIDIYPNWKRTCIMETELEDRDEEVAFPTFIEIIKEVTGDKKYSNAGMAESFPPEILEE